MQDDRLRLIFTCCHPALAAEAQLAPMLRLIAGLGLSNWVVAPLDFGCLHRYRRRAQRASIEV